MQELFNLNFVQIGIINWLSAGMGYAIYILMKYQNARATCKARNVPFDVRLFWEDKWPSFTISLFAMIICMWGLVNVMHMNPITSGAIGSGGATIFYNLTQTIIKRMIATKNP